MSSKRGYVKLPGNKDARIRFVRSLSNKKQGDFLLSTPQHIRTEILTVLTDEEIVLALHHMDPDQIADLVQCISSSRRNRIMKHFSMKTQHKINSLMRFNPQSAAGIMSLEYIQVQHTGTFGQVSANLKKHERRTGRFPAILVINNGMLIGEVKGHELVLRNKNERVAKYVSKIPVVRYSDDQDEIIRVFRKHRHNKIAVIDEDNSVMGIIYADDVLKNMQSGQSLYDFAGLSDEETIFNSPASKVRHRYQWLIINIFHAFLAVIVISYFEDTIATAVLLAAYMPIVAGMAGNAATQTLAVVVRGLALGHIDYKSSKRFIWNEVLAGVANGIIIGVLVGVIAVLWNTTWMFGLVLGLAMIINLALAGIFGGVIPLVLHKFGKDPASSATIFITTLTDVFGFFIFLGLATILLV